MKKTLVKPEVNYSMTLAGNVNQNIFNANSETFMVVLYPKSRKLNYINDEINNTGISSYVALKDEWDFTKAVSVTNYH